MAMLQLFAYGLLALVRTLGSRIRRGPRLPTWTFGFEWLVRTLRTGWDASTDWPHEKRRAHLDRLPSETPGGVSERDEAIARVPVRWFRPRDPAFGVCVLFLHGGSYTSGSVKTTHRAFAGAIAERASVEVLGVDYRLAPEHAYPAQLDDVLGVLRALEAREAERRAFVIVGDSAGANLAVACALALRGAPIAPKALVLVSPWVDLRMLGESFETNEAFDIGARPLLIRQAEAFAGDLTLEDPRISPGLAGLEGLPPTFIVYGGSEALRSDIEGFISRLRDADVSAELHVASEMPHDPPLFARFHPEADRALDALARAVRATTATRAGLPSGRLLKV